MVPRIDHAVQDWRYDALIRDIHADHVIARGFSRVQALRLVIGRNGIGRHVLVGNRNAPREELPLRLLHSERHRIPPGMDDLVREIEAVAVLFRHIRVELVVEINRAVSGSIRQNRIHNIGHLRAVGLLRDVRL